MSRKDGLPKLKDFYHSILNCIQLELCVQLVTYPSEGCTKKS